MSLSGSLTIQVAWVERRIEVRQVRLQRPPVSRLLVGRRPAEVASALPLIYTLCAYAQGKASEAAMLAATGELGAAAAQGLVLKRAEPDKGWFEFLHEHFWRLLLDWPLTVERTPLRSEFAIWRNSRHEGFEALCAATRHVRDEVLPPIYEAVAARLPNDEQAESMASSIPLALWQHDWVAPTSIAAAFRQRQAWVREGVEALQAEQDYPLCAGTQDNAEGMFGIGRTLTARGLLEHRVRMDEERSASYSVWAPTDVLFANENALGGMVGRLSPEDQEDADVLLRQAILSLDPCVPFTVEWVNA